MPSLQSLIFKIPTKILSARMAATTSLAKRRAIAGTGSDHPRLPRGVTSQLAKADGVAVEWITPDNVSSPSLILYLHGGGWTLGWYQSHRWLVANLCHAAGCRALAVDYRLAPENPFPAALDDCLAVYRWLLKSGTPAEQIVVAGDSAGGNLTLTTLMVLRDAGDPLPAAAVCICPMTDLAGTGQSFHTHKDALLTTELALFFARQYFGDQNPRLPLISPHYGDLSGLPPLLIHAGEDEILLSDAQRLVIRAAAAGVDARLVIWPAMWHDWHIFTPFLPEAQQAVKAIGAFVREKAGAAVPAKDVSQAYA